MRSPGSVSIRKPCSGAWSPRAGPGPRDRPSRSSTLPTPSGSSRTPRAKPGPTAARWARSTSSRPPSRNRGECWRGCWRTRARRPRGRGTRAGGGNQPRLTHRGPGARRLGRAGHFPGARFCCSPSRSASCSRGFINRRCSFSLSPAWECSLSPDTWAKRPSTWPRRPDPRSAGFSTRRSATPRSLSSPSRQSAPAWWISSRHRSPAAFSATCSSSLVCRFWPPAWAGRRSSSTGRARA